MTETDARPETDETEPTDPVTEAIADDEPEPEPEPESSVDDDDEPTPDLRDLHRELAAGKVHDECVLLLGARDRLHKLDDLARRAEYDKSPDLATLLRLRSHAENTEEFASSILAQTVRDMAGFPTPDEEDGPVGVRTDRYVALVEPGVFVGDDGTWHRSFEADQARVIVLSLDGPGFGPERPGFVDLSTPPPGPGPEAHPGAASPYEYVVTDGVKTIERHPYGKGSYRCYQDILKALARRLKAEDRHRVAPYLVWKEGELIGLVRKWEGSLEIMHLEEGNCDQFHDHLSSYFTED